MPVVLKSWSEILVGYELWHPDPAVTPQLQGSRAILCGAFSASHRIRWMQGGTTAVEVGETETGNQRHAWVGRVLQHELNRALTIENKHFTITEADLVHEVGGESQLPGEGDHAKPDGTQCKLIGERWFDYRSYAIDATVFGFVPGPGLLMLATLCWPCDSDPEPLTAAAARSQGAGTPAGGAGSTARKPKRRASP